MPSLIAPLVLLSLAFAAFSGQAAPDDEIAQTRVQLEAERRELLANIADPAWMRNSARATIVRLAIERNWRKCTANEGAALARASERPARLLAEAALAACRPWETALVDALENGADPYLGGRVSREDMVAGAQLQSRDAALARILMWRGVPARSAAAAPAPPAPPPNANRDLVGGSAPSVLLQPFPKPPVREPAPVAPDAAADEAEIVVVARRRNVCEVRFADRMLSERELADRAKQWAAAGVPLRIVRPPGATYGCVAKITRHLGRYGVRLFQVVEP
ncbi:MAG: hypothetical protein V4574_00400 [Pseudomonadota bacterium]